MYFVAGYVAAGYQIDGIPGQVVRAINYDVIAGSISTVKELSYSKSSKSICIAKELQYNKSGINNVTLGLNYNKRNFIDTTLKLSFDKASKYYKVMGISYNIFSDSLGPHITKSSIAIPDDTTYPSYLDGSTALWDAPYFKYLDGNIRNIEAKDTNYVVSVELPYDNISPYSFSMTDYTNGVLAHGPADIRYTDKLTVNGITIDQSKKYSKIGNVQLLKITDTYYVYTIVDSLVYGDFLIYTPGMSMENNKDRLTELSAETTFVIEFPYNKTFSLISLHKPEIISGSTLGGLILPRYSNSEILESEIVAPAPSVVEVSVTVIPVIGNFTVLKGGENIYYGGGAFYYFATPPIGPVSTTPIISLANAANGDYSTDVSVVGLSYNPGSYKLNGVEINITSNTIIYYPGALINRSEPVIVNLRNSVPVIFSTDNFNTISIPREEYQLVGYIIINGIDYWAKLTWASPGLYTITSYSQIVDITKIATKELLVVKEFNKYN